MNHRYDDILSRIPDPPLWWDEHAVPRYCEFGPRENADIYADEVALVLIQCQDCGTEYKVCISESRTSRMIRGHGLPEPIPSLAERIERGEVHYGDPPNNCPRGCCAGATMSSVPVRVLEYWGRPDDPHAWDKVRRAELERDVWPDWMPREAQA